MRSTLVFAVLACVGSAQGAITAYLGQDGSFSPTDTAIFDDTFLGGGGTGFGPFDTHGLNFRSVNTNANFWGYAFPGGNGTASCYFNGGASDVLGVKKTDNSDFAQVETMVGAGFGGPNVYLWVQAYNNGVQVGSFDLDTTYGQYIGVKGGGFDEVRIGGYNDAGSRNAHNEGTFQALAVDNFSWGGNVPAPSAAALLGLGGLAAGRRRR